jgi:hypothetical protein
VSESRLRTHADTYAFFHYANGGDIPTINHQAIFKPGAGAVGPKASANLWPTVICNASSDTTTRLYNGQTPACPVLPLVGYLGNPALTAVVFLTTDVIEGIQASVILYGVAHSYLISKQAVFNGIWATGANTAMGMRYE